MTWLAKWLEKHPIAWRAALILLCIFAVGYFEAQDKELSRHATPFMEAGR